MYIPTTKCNKLFQSNTALLFKLFSYRFNLLCKEVQVISFTMIVVSLANNVTVMLLLVVVRSLMYITNKIGPEIDQCGTPFLIVTNSD